MLVCYQINATMTKKIKEPIRLREKRLANGNRSLYLDIYYDGKREYEFLRLYLIPETDKASRDKNRQTMALANAVKAKRIVELQNTKHGFAYNTLSDMTVVDYYSMMVEKKGRNVWNASLTALSRYCGTRIKMKDIDARFCEGYKSFLATQRARDRKVNGKLVLLSKASQNAYLDKFKAFIRNAYNEGAISEDFSRNIKPISHTQAKREYLTLEELRSVAGAECKYEVVKRAFLFSCFTGLRLSDIIKLKWSEVSYANGYTRIVFRQKKTGVLEYLDINEQAAAMMGARGKDDDKVFLGMKQNNGLRIDLNRLMESAGITKHITFHCARHTFATMMLTLGTDIYTTSKLLGHTDVKTTEIYAKIIDEKKRSAVSNIPKII